MKEDEVISIADKYIALRLGPNPKLAGEPCGFHLMGATYKADSWTVLYKIIMLDAPDDVVDGPMIIVVSPTSKEAKFFDEMY
jgi:hypothetical protein